MDKTMAANFVGVLVAALRAEIAETSQRGERLHEAVKHNAAAREGALAAIESIRAQRARREARASGAEQVAAQAADREDD
jgi:hypothetical protein